MCRAKFLRTSYRSINLVGPSTSPQCRHAYMHRRPVVRALVNIKCLLWCGWMLPRLHSNQIIICRINFTSLYFGPLKVKGSRLVISAEKEKCASTKLNIVCGAERRGAAYIFKNALGRRFCFCLIVIYKTFWITCNFMHGAMGLSIDQNPFQRCISLLLFIIFDWTSFCSEATALNTSFLFREMNKRLHLNGDWISSLPT